MSLAVFLPLAFLQNIGMPELIIILIVALLIFGNRLPEVARKVGMGISEFKRGVQEASDEVKREIEKAPDAHPTAPPVPAAPAAPPQAAAPDAASGAPKEVTAVKPEPPPQPPQSAPPPTGDANLN